MTLITLQQQQQIKPISNNWAVAGKQAAGVSNYDQLAAEVEESKLRKLVGTPLLQDLQDNPTDANNIILLDGGSFINSSGDTIKFKGLRYVLAYLNWHKYVGQSFLSDTFTGMVRKNRSEAENISQGDIKRQQLEAEEIGLGQWELVEAYLNNNKETYPLWKCGSGKRPYTPRITGIKKTIY